jgi:hypothetical protein
MCPIMNKDNPFLMTREKGRDGIIFQSSRIVGNIQCKHSTDQNKKEKNNDIEYEIVKFLIHSLKNPKFIPDRTNFTYYYVISHGFDDIQVVMLLD